MIVHQICCGQFLGLRLQRLHRLLTLDPSKASTAEKAQHAPQLAFWVVLWVGDRRRNHRKGKKPTTKDDFNESRTSKPMADVGGRVSGWGEKIKEDTTISSSAALQKKSTDTHTRRVGKT